MPKIGNSNKKNIYDFLCLINCTLLNSKKKPSRIFALCPIFREILLKLVFIVPALIVSLPFVILYLFTQKIDFIKNIFEEDGKVSGFVVKILLTSIFAYSLVAIILGLFTIICKYIAGVSILSIFGTGLYHMLIMPGFSLTILGVLFFNFLMFIFSTLGNSIVFLFNLVFSIETYLTIFTIISTFILSFITLILTGIAFVSIFFVLFLLYKKNKDRTDYCINKITSYTKRKIDLISKKTINTFTASTEPVSIEDDEKFENDNKNIIKKITKENIKPYWFNIYWDKINNKRKECLDIFFNFAEIKFGIISIYLYGFFGFFYELFMNIHKNHCTIVNLDENDLNIYVKVKTLDSFYVNEEDNSFEERNHPYTIMEYGKYVKSIFSNKLALHKILKEKNALEVELMKDKNNIKIRKEIRLINDKVSWYKKVAKCESGYAAIIVSEDIEEAKKSLNGSEKFKVYKNWWYWQKDPDEVDLIENEYGNICIRSSFSKNTPYHVSEYNLKVVAEMMILQEEYNND